MKAEKWQKVASYQEKRTDQVVRCHLCPHVVYYFMPGHRRMPVYFDILSIHTQSICL